MRRLPLIPIVVVVYVFLAVTGNPAAATWQGSFDASYQAASPGDTIVVPAGTYGAQTINYDPAKAGATSRVVFAADGVSVGGLELRGVQHMEVRGLRVDGLWNVRPSTGSSWTAASKPSADLVFSGMTAQTFLFRNVDGLLLRDSTIGNQDASFDNLGPPKIGAYEPSGTSAKPSTNVTIRNVAFRDLIRTVVGGPHAECLYLDQGIDGLLVEGSSFTNCAVFDVFMGDGPVGGIDVRNVVFDANLMDVPRDVDGTALPSVFDFKGGGTNITLRGNSILGNIRRDEAAYPGWVTTKNAIGGTGGSGSDVMAADPGFVSASKAPCNIASCFRNDLHVLAGSLAGRAGAGVPVQGGPPPPACPGTSLPLTKVAEDATTVTFAWQPVSGATGYRFSRSDQQKRSHTWDAGRSTVRFGKIAGGGCYRVEALGILADGGSSG